MRKEKKVDALQIVDFPFKYTVACPYPENMGFSFLEFWDFPRRAQLLFVGTYTVIPTSDKGLKKEQPKGRNVKCGHLKLVQQIRVCTKMFFFSFSR